MKRKVGVFIYSCVFWFLLTPTFSCSAVIIFMWQLCFLQIKPLICTIIAYPQSKCELSIIAVFVLDSR